MRKKGRRAGMSSSSGHTVRGPDGSKAGNRGRQRKVFTTVNSSLDPSVTSGEITSLDTSRRRTIDNAHRSPPDNRRQPLGRLPTALCRLCHGKFSPRSLRHAFNKRSHDLVEVPDDDESDPSGQSPLLFHTDFQSLVGVPVCRDPRLSEFICKKCHDNFYKCHSILLRFLQRVNLLPLGNDTNTVQKGAKCSHLHVDPDSVVMSSITSDPKGLHRLVSWAHYHGEACRSCPDLKEVLEGQCWGSVRAVWGCVDGHSYVMDAQQHGGVRAGRHGNSGHSEAASRGQSVGGGHDDEEDEDDEGEGEESRASLQALGSRTAGLVQTGLNHIGPAATTQPAQSSTTTDRSIDNSEVYLGEDENPSPAMQPEDRSADSDLSERELSIEDDFENSGKRNILDDELFEPYPEKRSRRQTLPDKKRRTPKSPEEPRVKKKPGPKPGWKNKFKSKGEELPNIYKCPYQGCTAVYRAPDGLKKHIKEHHEEVRERPCPHPGCNKVFMIDRYLQRHIKLIHTEERNYICDQCGQTFKQRKHLSVHQMRHSGAKPLQCEVCGFQCRQRASLKYHMTKHKAEADLEFACVLCGKRFEKAHNLNVHMSMVHPLTQGEGQRAAAPPQQHNSLYSEVHTITVSGEVVQQEQDR